MGRINQFHPLLNGQPEGWELSTIGDEVNFTRKPHGFKIGAGDEIPFIPMEMLPDSSISASRWETRLGKNISSGVFFNEGDILLAKITPCLENGKQGIARNIPGGWGFATTEVYPIRPKRIDTEFLAFYLKEINVHRWLASKLHGATGRQRLPKDALQLLSVPVPPLPEQRAIAQVLRTVQRAKEATENVIATARQLKQSLMRHLFTYGPIPFPEADQVELNETKIGEIPANWQLSELQEIADIVYGVQAAVAHLTDKSVGIPILTNVNITNEGIIDLATLRYYDLPEKKRDKLILQKGDVLFNWRSGSDHHVGKSAIFDLDGSFTFASFILRFRTKGQIIPNYLYQYLHWLKSRGYFSRYREQSSVNKVFNASAAAKLTVAIPKENEQESICENLATIDRKLRSEQAKYKALNIIFQSLLHNLMTGQIRVHDLDLPVLKEVA